MRNNDDRTGAKQQDQAPPPQAMQKAPPKDDLPQALLDFVNPTTFVSLPSRGRFYQEGHPLHGATDVEIRQMTTKQEDILTSRTLLKKGIAIDRFVQSLVVDTSINVDTLTVGDKNAIIVSARIDGYGPEYKTTVTCPSCGESSETFFDLTDVSEHDVDDALFELPENVTETGSGTFTITLDAGFEVEVRALTSADEKKLVRSLTQRQKAKMEETALTDQMRAMIVSIVGYSDRATINKAVGLMPVRASRELRETYQKIIPNIDLKREYTCNSCGYETEMEVPLTAEFFWPKS